LALSDSEIPKPTPSARLPPAPPGHPGAGRRFGDLKSLEGRLAGFSRLRISGYRVIYAQRIERGSRVIECLFAERRALVYDLFAKLLVEQAGA
jgi:hypothetical protein